MQLKMYDLCGADKDRRFSPFCWRIKMALAHKGLDTEFIPWKFTDKEALAPTREAMSRYIRSVMTLKNKSYPVLVCELETKGLVLTEANLRSKISKGVFSASLLIAIIEIIGVEETALCEILKIVHDKNN